MRIPALASVDRLLAVWAQFRSQYEKDFEALRPTEEDITLVTSTAVTVYSNFKIRPTSNVFLTPKTAHAASEIGNGTLYIDTPTQGAVNINHASNSQADRIYRITVTGT